MNDFTKDELIELQEASNYWHEGIETALTAKLKFMIDNYCDHDWDYGCRASYRCRSCGKLKDE
jgi:hypothetical protein